LITQVKHAGDEPLGLSFALAWFLADRRLRAGLRHERPLELILRDLSEVGDAGSVVLVEEGVDLSPGATADIPVRRQAHTASR
jgi:hypothetical protein